MEKMERDSILYDAISFIQMEDDSCRCDVIKSCEDCSSRKRRDSLIDGLQRVIISEES